MFAHKKVPTIPGIRITFVPDHVLFPSLPICSQPKLKKPEPDFGAASHAMIRGCVL